MPDTKISDSQFIIALTLVGSIQTSFFTLITNPRYFIAQTLNSDLLISSYSLASYICSNTFYICLQCFWILLSIQTRMSSIYTKQKSSRQSCSIQLIYYQNVLRAFTSLNGVTSYSQSLYLVQKAVIYSWPSQICIL